MATFLFKVEEENRLEQKGLLKRFNLHCIGKQPSIQDIRAEKTEKFKELANKKGTREYEMWFLNYNPGKLNEPSIYKKKKYTHKEKHSHPTKKRKTYRVRQDYLY